MKYRLNFLLVLFLLFSCFNLTALSDNSNIKSDVNKKKDIADKVLISFINGDYKAVRENLDETLLKLLSEDVLKATWEQTIAAFGAYKGLSDSIDEKIIMNYDVFYRKIYFENTTLNTVLSISKDDKVAGFQMLPIEQNKNVEYVKLKDIAEVIRGGNFQKRDFVESGRPCIHYGQIYTKYGSNANETFSFISEENFNKSKQAQPNDIIMAVTSENVEDVCKCVVWCGNENVAVSGHTAIIHHNINSKYLGYYFSTSHFYKTKTKLVHGTKVMEVTPSSLNEILIPVPKLEEQNKIADLIEKYEKIYNAIVIEIPKEIEKNQKQYEYYRDKLLSFKEVEVNE